MTTARLRRTLLWPLLLCAAIPACDCGSSKNLCKGVGCTAADACHLAGACDTRTGKCSNPAAQDGTSCADADKCNGAETCAAGICTAGTAVACNSPSACETATGATCTPSTGACTYASVCN